MPIMQGLNGIAPMDKGWKKFERVVAARVGGKRIPVTGLDRAGADVVAGKFFYQAKLRRGLPSYLHEWVDGIAETAKRKGAIGIVIWKQPGERVDDSIVLMKLTDWQKLHGSQKKKRSTIKPSVPRSGPGVLGTRTNDRITEP